MVKVKASSSIDQRMEFNEVFLRRAIRIEDIRIDDNRVSMRLLYLKGETEESMFTLHLLNVEFVQIEISDFSRYASLDVDDKQLVLDGDLSKLTIVNPSLEFECHYKTAQLEPASCPATPTIKPE